MKKNQKNSFKLLAFCFLSIALPYSCNAAQQALSEAELSNDELSETESNHSMHQVGATDSQLDMLRIEHSYKQAVTTIKIGAAVLVAASWALTLRSYMNGEFPRISYDPTAGFFDATVAVVSGAGGALIGHGTIKCNQANQALLKLKKA